MIDLGNQNIMIIAPHPDDEIIGCGGLISRCKQAGGQVHVLYMTIGDTPDYSNKGGTTQSERIKEVEQLVKYLNIDDYDIAFPGNDHHLKLDNIPQKELISKIEAEGKISLQKLNPTILITTSSFDYNQDHYAVHTATISATRPSSKDYKNLQPLVLTYELPYMTWTSDTSSPVPNVYVELDDKSMDEKVKALQIYKSQLKHPTSPISTHAVETLAKLRGLQCGIECAEAFYLKRCLM